MSVVYSVDCPAAIDRLVHHATILDVNAASVPLACVQRQPESARGSDSENKAEEKTYKEKSE